MNSSSLHLQFRNINMKKNSSHGSSLLIMQMRYEIEKTYV